MYKKGTGNDKQGKDAGNRTLCPYRNFSQAIRTHTIEANLFLMWADSVELEYPDKIQTQDQSEFSKIFKVSPIA